MKLQINKIKNEAIALTETKKEDSTPYHVHYNIHLEDNQAAKTILSDTKLYSNKILKMVTNMTLFNVLIVIVIALLILIILKKFNVVKLMKKIKI